MFAWFAFFRVADPARRVLPAEIETIAGALRGIADADAARIFTPALADTAHPFPNDEAPPTLALQLHFATIGALEAALAADGALAGIASLPSLLGAAIGHQAMVARIFPVPDAQLATPTGALPCSYLVHYSGAAEDLIAWHTHYLAHHPGLMARFPGVREIEIYSRLDWLSALPWPRLDVFQRNKLVFDSAPALSASLLSPAIRDMRADYHQFPPFTGGNVHYPMLTRLVRP